jgi:WD40 repeat protein
VRLAISADGALLASGGGCVRPLGSRDCDVRLWRLPDGAPLATLTGHTDQIMALAMNPESTLLASASTDTTVRLWRLPDGAPLATLTGHTRQVLKLAISSDGPMLTSASCGEPVRLRHLPDGAPLGSLNISKDGDWTLAMSQDGTLLASGPSDGPARLRSLALPLASVPIGGIDPVRQAWLSEQLRSPRAKPEERRWLEFIAALIRWRGRYDISLAAAPAEGPGEFDIQLGT